MLVCFCSGEWECTSQITCSGAPDGTLLDSPPHLYQDSDSFRLLLVVTKHVKGTKAGSFWATLPVGTFASDYTTALDSQSPILPSLYPLSDVRPIS